MEVTILFNINKQLKFSHEWKWLCLVILNKHRQYTHTHTHTYYEDYISLCRGGCPRVPHLSRGFNDHHVVLSSEVVREKHGRVSSRGDSLKLSVLLFRGNTVGWELSRRKKPRRPWRPATVSSVSQRTSPGKVVKWNPPVSSLTMFPFEYFFVFFFFSRQNFFSPGEGDVSLLLFFLFLFYFCVLRDDFSLFFFFFKFWIVFHTIFIFSYFNDEL